MMRDIEVLRLGHRPQRDKRITTHVCLTARALGARRVRIAEADGGVVATVRDVVRRFGGDFQVEDGAGWKGPVRAWQEAGGVVMHLTMYGEPLGDAAAKAAGRDVLLVVGAEKVPGDLYAMADINAAVGHQPHSEVAALALAMDRLREGAWERDSFSEARLRIVGQPRGKHVEQDGDQAAGPGASQA